MTITVKGWHGNLSPQKSKDLDEICGVTIKPRMEWEFEGGVEDFAQRWRRPFLAYPQGQPRKDDNVVHWLVFVTDYPSFQAR